MTNSECVRRIIKRMRCDPAKPFKTCEAAFELGVETATLIDSFNKLTGITPKLFHSALRIEKAKQLLAESNLPLIDVCFEVGYESPGSFYRIFRKTVGLTPRDYRRLSHGEAISEISAEINRGKRPRFSGMRLNAVVVGAEQGQTLAAGLFRRALPAGFPFDGCFVDNAFPNFSLEWPSGAVRLNLLAASIEKCCFADLQRDHFSVTHVAKLEIDILDLTPPTTFQLHLRLVSDFDPPVLLPVPIMLNLESRRRQQ